MALQPFEIGHAVVAKALQRRVTDDALRFMLQIIEHGLRRVGKASLLLLLRAAAGIHDTAGQRARAAAIEAVDDEHVNAACARFERGRRARSAPADHEHVGTVIPLNAVEPVYDERFLHRCIGGRGSHGRCHDRLPSKSVRSSAIGAPFMWATAR